MIVRVDDLVEAIGDALYRFMRNREWAAASIEVEVTGTLWQYRVSCTNPDGQHESLSLESDFDAWNEFEDLYDDLWTRFPDQGEEPWVRSNFTLQCDGQARLTFAYADSDPETNAKSPNQGTV